MTQSKTFEEFWNNPETIALRKKMNNKEDIKMSQKENIRFYDLLVKLANTDDMANMQVINKANELLNLINEL